jgi:prophage antirepressor-like protein
MISKDVQNFAFGDALVRVVMRSDEPWFVGIDICRALELKNPHSTLELIREEDKHLHTMEGNRGERTVTIVSEGAMYGLVFKSRKPIAEKFQRWVTHEVLPAIRRHGGYGHNSGAREPIEDGVHPQDISFAEKLRAVELAMRVHGRARARIMWRTMGLPAVPEAPPTIHDEALVCLRHLLDFIVTDIDGEQARIRDLIDEAIDDNEGSRQLIMRHGVKLHHSGRGFVVANCGDGIARIYGGTRWAKGRHYWMLRKLAGVKANGNTKFFGVTHKATFVPMKYLDEGAPAPDLDEAMA